MANGLRYYHWNSPGVQRYFRWLPGSLVPPSIDGATVLDNVLFLKTIVDRVTFDKSILDDSEFVMAIVDEFDFSKTILDDAEFVNPIDLEKWT